MNELKSFTMPDGTTIARRVPTGNGGGIRFVLMVTGLMLLITDYWVVGLMLLAMASIIGKSQHECGACGTAVSSRSQICRICRVQLMRRIPANLDPRPWFVRPMFLKIATICAGVGAIYLLLRIKTHFHHASSSTTLEEVDAVRDKRLAATMVDVSTPERDAQVFPASNS